MHCFAIVCSGYFRRVPPTAVFRRQQQPRLRFSVRSRFLGAVSSSLSLSAVGRAHGTAQDVHSDVAMHSSARVTLGPPGAGADDRKVERFSWHVRRTLGLGEVVELDARGPRAVMNALRAMASGDHCTEFEVSWEGDGGTRHLRFVARARAVPAALDSQRKGNASSELVASGKGTVLQLARALSSEEARRGFACVAAREDDEAALNILAKALATAPSTGRVCRQLRCFPEFIQGPGGPRLLVYLQGAPAELPKRSGVTFTAVPPGAGADRAYTLRFFAATHDRLRRGDDVQMECRGPNAVWHSVRAFSELSGHTVDVEASWCQRPVKVALQRRAGARPDSASETRPEARTEAMVKDPPQTLGKDGNEAATEKKEQHFLNVIAFQGRRGVAYEKFNAIDFTETRRLLVAGTSNVRTLAWAIVKEVRQRKGVAVHAYADDRASVNIAVKALATVPRLTGGAHFSFVPSLGSSKGPGKQVLRLYVRRVLHSQIS